MENWQQTIASQFSNSPTLLALIESFNDAADPSGNIASFTQDVLDVTTAVGFGLEVWGRIVGVSRVLKIAETSPSDPSLGFSQAVGGGLIDSFGNAPFYSVPVTQNYSLSDDDFRRLILLKALSNISGRSTQDINRSLMTFFAGRGNAYVIDAGAMRMLYRFEFDLTPVERAIIQQSGAFTSPTGVLVDFFIGDILTEDGFNLLTENSANLAQEY